MKRPNILTGIAFAFVVAVFTVPAWWGLKTALPFFLAFRLITLGAYFAYCFYLLKTARSRIGTLTLATVNLVVGVALSALPVTNSLVVVALVAMVTLNRLLLFQRSLVAVALDGLLSIAGLMFAGYLFSRTGSVPAALWSFFLLQSVFVMIPRSSSVTSPGGPDETENVDLFVRGQRQAEAALERIVQGGSY